MPTFQNTPGYIARRNYFYEQRLEGAQGSIGALRLQALREFRARLKTQTASRSRGSVAPQQARPLTDAVSTGSGIVGVPHWAPLGPSVMLNGQAATSPPVSGRIAGIAISPNGKILYAGAANGGVWRSVDGGHHWYATMNAFNLQPNATQSDSLSVGAVALDPQKPQRVFVGSGEGGNSYVSDSASAGGVGYFGVGPVVSEDGGASWNTESRRFVDGTISFDWSDVSFYKLAVDPRSPSRVLAATTDGIYVRQSRNFSSFDPDAEYIPQSYLFILEQATGIINTSYWRKNLSDLEGTQLGASSTFKGYDVLVTLPIEGVPYILMYSSQAGDKPAGSYLLYFIQNDGIPTPATQSAGTWQAGLSLIPFNLGGTTRLLTYLPATGAGTLYEVDSSGAFMVVQAQLSLKANLSYIALMIRGQSILFGYNPTDGSALMYGWEQDGTLTTLLQQNAGTWPLGGTITAFSMEGNPFFIIYEPNTGAYSINRVQDSLVPLTTFAVATGSPQAWKQNLKLLPFTFNDAPYLLTSSNADGDLNLYGLKGCTAEPEFKWTQDWAGPFQATPFLMGYEWALKLPPNTQKGNAVTDMVASSNGVTTTFFAGFTNTTTFWSTVFFSTDGGQTWTKVGVNDLNFVGRISLGVSPTQANILYTVDSQAKLGHIAAPLDTSNWSLLTNAPTGVDLVGFNDLDPNNEPGQGNYDLVIAVAPNDPNLILLGGSTVKLTVAGHTQWSGSLWRCVVDQGTHNCTSKTVIGASLHADLHALAFDPSNPNSLWVGCDGGMFHTIDVTAVNVNHMFQPKNAGLSTMTQEQIGQHPTYDAVLFGCSQDNGCHRYFGDEAWQGVFLGDSGAAVVNWSNTAQVICSYTLNTLYSSTTYGNNGTFTARIVVPLLGTDSSLWYAPLIGSPKTTGVPNRLAFGSKAPWISDNFGTTWTSLPANDATDQLATQIRALAFSADSKTLFVGTLGGQVWVYKSGTPWTRTQIDNTGQQFGLPAAAPITSIAIDPAEKGSLWICYGGAAAAIGARRVWYYNASQQKWFNRSGTGTQSLLNIQFNTLAVGPATNEIWAGADIGIWHSLDGGNTWEPKSEGLPEAAVLSLNLFPANSKIQQPALMRATTYGRGTYEQVLSTDPQYLQGVQLYFRRTPLDRGLYPVVDGLVIPDGTNQTTSHRNSPDMKLIKSVANNFVPPGSINFQAFATLEDQSGTMSQQTLSRIFVQVHQRGVLDATNTKVRVLLSTKVGATAPTQPTASKPAPSPKPPALPSDLSRLLLDGIPVSAPANGQAGWFDLGTYVINELIAGVPKVVNADIAIAQLPSPGIYCVLAITYQAQDPFTSTQTDADALTIADPQVAMKYITVS